MSIEKDYTLYTGGWLTDAATITCTGPNRKNNAKLSLAQERKRYSAGEYTFRIDVRQYRGEEVYCVLIEPTPLHLARMQQEREEELKNATATPFGARRDWLNAFRRSRKRRAKRSKCSWTGWPELDVFETLEEVLSRPRCRKQRGWGECYRPTRKRYDARYDTRTWKRNRNTQYHPL